MSDKMQVHDNAFSNSVQNLLRVSGYSQKQLAEALYLAPKVLSRKLNGTGNSHLTHTEIRNILFILARWHAITTQDDAIQLLELAHVGSTLFDIDEWNVPPLNQLEKKGTRSTDSAENSDSVISSLHNFSAPTTPFIGREWAIERLRNLFESSDIRLVSLVGTGGSGKTRLALHVAQELVGMFEHGVWFVALAGVKNPDLVPLTIAQALNVTSISGVPIMESLCKYLRKKHMLLVLDNFEQVETAAPVISELLAAAPHLKVLVTSRSLLRLYGEHPLRIPTLDLPDIHADVKANELIHYESVRLFIERVQEFMPDFTLTEENKASIAQICVKVEGLPLALELAAARVRVLSLEQLLERLSTARLAILTGGARNLPGRHQTLRNTIIWSYNLLPSEEKVWFPRFGVFRGGWSLEAVEAMAQGYKTDSEEQFPDATFMLDVIEQLADNSLLVRITGPNKLSRFTMLETLREYARELLIAQEELVQWQDWHACYYLRLAEEAEPGLRGPQQMRWLERLTSEWDNFRVALEWLLQRARDGVTLHVPDSLEQGMVSERRRVGGSRVLSSESAPCTGRLALEACLRLASALRPYWEWQGYVTEARHWLQDVLAIPVEESAEKTVLAARAKALSEMARLLCLQNEQRRAVELIEESLALWQQLDDPVGVATVLLHRGWVAQSVSENVEAGRIYEKGLQALEGTDETWLRAQLLCYVAAAAGFTFDFDRMRSFYEKGNALFEQLGDKCALADFLKDQGALLILDSKYDEAITCLLKSIALCKELDQRQYITSGMGWLAYAIGMRGEPDSATASIYTAKLKGAVQGLMDAAGTVSWTKTHPMTQLAEQHIRSQIDEQSWEAAWEQGRKLNIEQAIELAFRLGGGQV